MSDRIQGLVDLVFDGLARPLPQEHSTDYSTVSRQYVEQNLEQHFRSIEFENQNDLERWCAIVDADDPSGVSGHVRRVSWTDINTLAKFEDHLRALTGVKEAEFYFCNILVLDLNLDAFTVMGSSLVKMEICGSYIIPVVLCALIETLPHLRELRVDELDLEDGPEVIMMMSTIPFFEGSSAFSIILTAFSPWNLGWIPYDARFRELRIDPLCACNCARTVNRWIARSGGGLESFTIGEASWGTFPGSTSIPRF